MRSTPECNILVGKIYKVPHLEPTPPIVASSSPVPRLPIANCARPPLADEFKQCMHPHLYTSLSNTTHRHHTITLSKLLVDVGRVTNEKLCVNVTRELSLSSWTSLRARFCSRRRRLLNSNDDRCGTFPPGRLPEHFSLTTTIKT